jgi:hypothetical protein
MSDQDRTIYVIGRMRGIKNFNHWAFKRATQFLRDNGWLVTSPHEEDLKAGFDVTKYYPEMHNRTWDDYPPESLFDVAGMEDRNEENVKKTRHIFVLKGGLGEGGLQEFAHAIMINKSILYERDGIPTWNEDKARDMQLDGLKETEKLYNLDQFIEPRSILLEADNIVNGDRQAAYGHPLDDFSKTAKIWEVILNAPVTAEQVGLCMCGVKISRELNTHSRDNLVDLAGYAGTIEKVVDERARRMI